jgi:hypothetical protein
MLIGIAGKKGAGKDTLAQDLVEHCHWINNYLAVGKVFHFADTLKKVTVEMLGVPIEMVYGTQQDKEQQCHLRWENMPTYELMGDVRPTGRMSVREVLQYFGTEILRKMHSRIHIDATLNAIAQYEETQLSQVLAVVADLRFPNECQAIKEDGGIVIGLTRGEKGDNHASENALDDYPFDVLIDNIGMSREEQLEAALKSLRRSYR